MFDPNKFRTLISLAFVQVQSFWNYSGERRMRVFYAPPLKAYDRLPYGRITSKFDSQILGIEVFIQKIRHLVKILRSESSSVPKASLCSRAKN